MVTREVRAKYEASHSSQVFSVNRHLRQGDTHVSDWTGTAALQDVDEARPAQPVVQGNIHAAGGAVSVA